MEKKRDLNANLKTIGIMEHKRTRIFAHRGASGYIPENTLDAFLEAVRQKADGVELDVQLSRDGELVVIHDERLERTSDGTGYVKDHTLAELKKYRYSKTIKGYKPLEIPTLGEVYQALKKTGLMINVELKTGEIWYPKIEEKVLEETAKYGMEERVIYSSFNHKSLQLLKKYNPAACVGMLFCDILIDADACAKMIPAQALHPSVEYIKMCLERDGEVRSKYPVRVWTVNREEDLRLFIRSGMDAVITNFPDRAVEIREMILEKY